MYVNPLLLVHICDFIAVCKYTKPSNSVRTKLHEFESFVLYAKMNRHHLKHVRSIPNYSSPTFRFSYIMDGKLYLPEYETCLNGLTVKRMLICPLQHVL